MSQAVSPNHREALTAESSINQQNEYVYSTNHALDVNIVGGGGSGGTSSDFGDPFPSVGTAVGFIDDNGDMAGGNLDSSGNLLVNIAAGGAGNGAILDFVNPAIGATVFDLANSNPLSTQIVDASGDAITSFGGGTQYQVDDVAGATDTGTLSLVVRDDALTTLTPADGDYVQMRTTSVGRLWTSTVVDTALPAGNNNIGDVDVASVAGNVTVVQGTATNLKAEVIGAGTAGTANAGVVTIQGIAGMTKVLVTPDANSAINIAQIGGNAVVQGSGTSTNALRVELPTNGTGTIASITTSVVPGTAATNLGKAEDAGHSSGDTGVMALGVRNDGAATALSNTDIDYTPLATDAQGRQYTVQKAPVATVTAVASSASNVTILSAATGRLGATIFNDSTQILYLKLGATASSSSYTVRMVSLSYYEVPYGYTGQIDGIWASANGNAVITELT